MSWILHLVRQLWQRLDLIGDDPGFDEAWPPRDWRASDESTPSTDPEFSRVA
jgi:hypothetical protein